MSRVLLLDFDGVMFRNPAANHHVVERSDMFVRKYVPNYDPKFHNYRVYGHTVKMMQTLFRVPVTMEEYNEYVFRPCLFASTAKTITEEDRRRTTAWKKIVRLPEMETHIFSNAPAMWVETILEQTGLDLDESSLGLLMTSDRLGILKPEEQAYMRMMDRVEKYPGSSRVTNEILFLDDAETNVRAAQALGWNAVLYEDTLDRLLMRGEAKETHALAR